MNKEAIEERLTGLRNELERTQAHGNALIGAIKDCEYWLNEIEKERKPNGNLSPASKTRDESCD